MAWRQHDAAQAEDQFQQQLSRTPTDPVSNYIVGLILQQKDQPAQAVPYLQAAVAVNPSYKDALLALGQCHLTLDKPDEAVKPLVRATVVDPEFGQAHFVLSRAYKKLGRTADAIREEKICSQLQARQHDSAQAAKYHRVPSECWSRGVINHLEIKGNSQAKPDPIQRDGLLIHKNLLALYIDECLMNSAGPAKLDRFILSIGSKPKMRAFVIC